MWIYFILALVLFLCLGTLWGYFTVLNQELEQKLIESDWRKWKDETKGTRYNGKLSWTSWDYVKLHENKDIPNYYSCI